MRPFNILFTLLTTCLFISCDTNRNANNNANSESNDNLMRYSKYITLYNYKSGYYINLLNPWQEGSLGEFYLYPDSLQLPDELENKQVIRTPVKSVVAYSSTQWSVFLKLNEIQRVKGILESSYTHNQEIKELISQGLIKDVGYENNIYTEKVIEIQPDVILYTPYSAVTKLEIGELIGTTVFPFADYLENHPLGRAEWLRIIGFLTCREKDTDEWFNDIVSNYESMKSLCDSIDYKPTVFSDLPFEGQWYAPGGKSYIAQIFNDSGADYIWKDYNSTASFPLDAESVLAKAASADYWRIMNSSRLPYSYERLSVENELYTNFKAFKKKQIIICDVQESEYFERSQYEPDILLKDFVKVFHPEVIESDYQPKYFYLLND